MRYGSDEGDEVQAAIRRHQREMEQDYRHAEDEYRQRKRAERLRAQRPVPGAWRFTELRSEDGVLSGWRVDLDGRIAGMIVIRGADLVVLASGDEEDENSPTATDIMAAYTKGPGRER